MYIEASSQLRYERAKLVSPRLSPSGCVTFWYHSYGAATGKLEVLQIDDRHILPDRETLVWNITGVNGMILMFTHIFGGF